MTNPAPLVLPVGATENSVRVDPVVLYTICDSYIRRSERVERVIGTLLGSVGDGVVDIRSCYAVPHSEGDDQVAVDVVHHQTMLSLQQKVNPRDKIVGWFSTGTDLAGSDALIHNFYADQCAKNFSPVHLVVDTTLQGEKMSIKAFFSRLLTLQGKELAREFQEVKCEIKTSETERVAGDVLGKEVVEKVPSELEGLKESLLKLRQTLDAAERYVTDVVEGRRPPSTAVGRQMAEAVAAVPHFTEDELAKLVRDNQNDILLTAYLAGLVKAHIALADKLQTMQLPLL